VAAGAPGPWRTDGRSQPSLTIMAVSETDGSLMGVVIGKADRENKRKRLRGYIAMVGAGGSARNRRG